MTESNSLAEQFEAHRNHLRGVAYRMLGSLNDADDAVQEAWLRASRADTSEVVNLGGWLTTVVSRICLNMLQSRKVRREEPLDAYIPDPIVSRDDGLGPEKEALLADSVGLGLLVVLETLTPAERLAFVLHDVFNLPFDEIAAIAGRTPAATRQLASRARRRVQGAPLSDASPDEQRRLVNAFFAAAHEGDFDGLMAILDPDIVLRSYGGRKRRGATQVVRGAAQVAGGALTYARLSMFVRPVLVNGLPGAIVVPPDGKVFAVMSFTVRGGKIVAIDALGDPDRLAALDLSAVLTD